jgi:hypothetical protein
MLEDVRDMTPIEIVVCAVILGVVGGIAWLAITVPIRVRLTHRLSADAGFVPCEGDRLAPDVLRVVADLRDLDFVVRGHWWNKAHSVATGQLTLMEHPETLDAAKILVTRSGTSRHVSLIFQTRFDDGTEIVTANNQITAGLPPVPGVTAIWLPEERDPRRLGHVHDQVRDGLGAGKKRLPVGPDPVAFLEAGRDRMHAHFVQTGYFYLDEAGGVYRPTWKGAVLITWRQLRVVRPFHQAWRRRPTRKILHELGVSLDPD